MTALAPLLLLLLAARQPPPVPAPTPLRAPVPEVSTLSDGTEVWLLHRPAVPLVRVEVSWRQGYLAQPDREAAMVAGALAGRRPGIGWDALEAMGGVAQIGAGAQRAWADVEVLKGHEEAAVAWLAEALLAPFDGGEVRRLSRRWAAARRETWRSLGRVHNLVLSSELYPDEHPLGFRPTAADWRSVSPRRVRRAWQRMLQHGDVAVFVAGDVAPGALAAPLEAVLREVGAAGEGAPLSIPPPDWPAQRRVVVVDHPGAQRAIISHTRPAPGLGTRDEVLAELADHVLGGSFTSRLSMRLREEEGYVYDIESSLLSWPGSGRVEITCSVGLDDVVGAVSAIAEELEGMVAEPPSAAEVAAAVEELRIEAAVGWLRLAELARPLGLSMLHGQPPDAIARRLAQLEAATAAEVAAEAASLLGGGGGLWVISGDAGELGVALPEAGWEIDTVRLVR